MNRRTKDIPFHLAKYLETVHLFACTDIQWIRLPIPNGRKQRLTRDKSGEIHYKFDYKKERYVRVNT